MKITKIHILFIILVSLSIQSLAQNKNKETLSSNLSTKSSMKEFEIVDNISFNKRYEIYREINNQYNWYFDRLTNTNDRKYGIVNINGDVIFPPILKLSRVSDNEIKVNIDKFYGVFNLSSLDWNIPMEYNSLSKNDAGYYIAQKHGKYGVIDSYNEIILPFEWESVSSISNLDNYVIVSKKTHSKLFGIYSLIEKTLIVPCEYHSISSVSNSNLFKVRKDNDYNILNLNNKLLLNSWYSSLNTSNKHNYITAEKNNLFGVIDENENIIIPFKYIEFSNYPYSDGSHLAKNKDGKYGFMTINGEITLPFEYDKISNKNNNNFTSLKNGKCGLVRVNSGVPSEIVTCDYDNISNENKIIITEQNKKFGLLDQYGKTIISPTYDEIKIVSSKYGALLLSAKLNGEYLLLDQTGKKANNNGFLEISPIIHSSSSYSSKTKFLKVLSNDGKYNIVDMTGRSVSTKSFDDITSEKENIFIVKNNGKYGLFYLLKQKNIVDCKYENLIRTKDYYIAISGSKLIFIETNAGKAKIIGS